MTPDEIRAEIKRLFSAINSLRSMSDQDTTDLASAQRSLNAAYMRIGRYESRHGPAATIA